MSRQTDRLTTAELKELIGWEKGDDEPGERVDTHSGYWLKDCLDSYRFVWTINPDE